MTGYARFDKVWGKNAKLFWITYIINPGLRHNMMQLL